MISTLRMALVHLIDHGEIKLGTVQSRMLLDACKKEEKSDIEIKELRTLLVQLINDTESPQFHAEVARRSRQWGQPGDVLKM